MSVGQGSTTSTHRVIWLLAAALVGGLAGCGSEESPPPGDGATTAADGGSSGAATAPPADAKPLVRTDSQGRKWLGEVPYDVWFDDPLAVAADSRAVARVEPGLPTTGTSPSPEPAPTTGSAPAPSAGSDWQQYIDMLILQEEVKQIRNDLTAQMQSVGKFNAGYEEIELEGATLAVVAAIVAEHPGDVTWKPNARYVRQLGTEMAASATTTGREAFSATQRPYEQVVALLSGNEPPDLPEAEASVPFAEAADRGPVMKRMQKSFAWLSSNINSESKLKSESERALHEASLLAALSKVISDASYDSTDEEEYAGYAKRMVEAALGAKGAVAADDYTGLTEQLSRAQKACNECHNDYRF